MYKHTPGPWHYSGDSLTHCQFDIYAPGCAPQQHVCTVNNLSVEKLYGRDPETALANARLISSAPELLEALRDAIDALNIHAPDSWVLIQARNTLAKATGL